MNIPALLCAGVPLLTSERIGRGGEGEVLAVADDPGRAVKLYLQPDAAHETKVRAIVAARLAERCASVAFPLQLVQHADGRFAGFTMRRVSDSQPVFELFATGSRRERFPLADWAFLVRTATNVARVVAQVHAGGAVIGDINSSGLLVSQQAMVTLIDADSFQVAGHRCRVGMPEYTPPELQGVRFGEIDRTVDHDAFGLAVMIFQLLALGRHPHAGVRSGRAIPIETAITQGRFAYSLIREVGSRPPPGALMLGDLPLGTRTLLERAFALRLGPRPTAAEWVRELALLEAELVRCVRKPHHVVPTLAAPCPWCRIEKSLGQPIFPVTTSSLQRAPLPRTDLHHEVARVLRCAKEHAGEEVRPMWQRPTMPPSKAALSLLEPDGQPPSWARVGLHIQLGLVPRNPALPFLKRHTEAQAAANIALERWRTELGVWDIRKRAETLQQSLADLNRLQANGPALLAQVTAQVIASEAAAEMRSKSLGAASVPGIGASLRTHLVKYGIGTAADITAAALQATPRLGGARIAALLLWRDRVRVEAQRAVAADPGRLRSKVAAAMAEKDASLAQAKDALRADAIDLEFRVSKVRRRLWLVDQKLEAILQSRDQAAVDLEVLGIGNLANALLPRSPVPPGQARKAKSKAKIKKGSRAPVTCPACGAPMVKRWGQAGQGGPSLFLGCSTYPQCTGSRNIGMKRRAP
jgi:DNA-binding helix-hairpin-helix protein with protein kinase domain